jgi:hypothetical protein
VTVDDQQRQGRPCPGNGGQDRRVRDAGTVVTDHQRVRCPHRIGEALGQALVVPGTGRMVGFPIEAHQDPIACDDAVLARGATGGGQHVAGADAVAVQTAQQRGAHLIVADQRHELGVYSQSRQIRGGVGGSARMSVGLFDVDDRHRAFPGQAPTRPGQPDVEHAVSEHHHAGRRFARIIGG